MASRHKADRGGKLQGDSSLSEDFEAMLADLDGGDADGFTSRDLRLRSGASRDKIKRYIQEEVDAGNIEYVGTRKEPDITGRTQRVPVYRRVKR